LWLTSEMLFRYGPIDVRLPTYAPKRKHESKLVWNGQAAEQYVDNLVTDDTTPDLFNQAIHDRHADRHRLRMYTPMGVWGWHTPVCV